MKTVCTCFVRASRGSKEGAARRCEQVRRGHKPADIRLGQHLHKANPVVCLEL